MSATNGRAMKAKGSQFERSVAAYLREHGHAHAERSYGAGRPDDRGDLDGLPRFCVEVKAHRALDLAAFVDEATAEAAHCPTGTMPVVIAKRRGRPTAESYVVMRLSDWAQLVAEEENS